MFNNIGLLLFFFFLSEAKLTLDQPQQDLLWLYVVSHNYTVRLDYTNYLERVNHAAHYPCKDKLNVFFSSLSKIFLLLLPNGQ